MKIADIFSIGSLDPIENLCKKKIRSKKNCIFGGTPYGSEYMVGTLDIKFSIFHQKFDFLFYDFILIYTPFVMWVLNSFKI